MKFLFSKTSSHISTDTVALDDFRNNNFDLVRLFAASQVLFFHGAFHLKYSLGDFWFLEAFKGVPIFFVVSGFLVSASFERSENVRGYFLNRSLRIFPALWVCLLATVGVILWYGVSFRWCEFLPWLVAQSTFGQYYNPDFLRGFATGVMNGSLWTIPIELQFYLFFPCIFLLLRKIFSRTPRNAEIVGAFVFFLCCALFVLWLRDVLPGRYSAAYALLHNSAMRYFYLFVLGWFLQRNILSLRRVFFGKAIFWISFHYFFTWLFVVKVGLLYHPKLFHCFNVLSDCVLGCVAISCAYTFRGLAAKLTRGNDISYGVYIYHMPLVNIMIINGLSGNPLSLPILLVGTAICALLSWFLVEKPCLAFKKRTLRALG
ncbi:MAG: acyltransferase [Puniceicoccales bacterium]|jgi:peptidoglycan/LPS O-acetylase OafA/YrhL|nr:acyltransferase [Puniceicoccales bacterium]